METKSNRIMPRYPEGHVIEEKELNDLDMSLKNLTGEEKKEAKDKMNNMP